MSSIDCRVEHIGKPQGSTFINQFSKRIVLRSLEAMKIGQLRIIDENQEQYVFGELETNSAYSATIHVHNADVYRQVLTGGTIGVGEAYIAGSWSTPDLVSMIRLFVANQAHLDDMENVFSKLQNKFSGLLHWLLPNTLLKAKKNILAHYDLSNEFFETFLDPSMMYSSGIFLKADNTMHEASINKLRIACDKLELCESDHLLEIGTGWGGLAIFAAKHYGCQVTTTTISDAQYSYAKQRVKEQGLDNLVTVLNQDYRALEGQYDKLISIEMIEAVGHKHYKKYFETCTKFLKPSGLMLIQAITTPDQRFASQKNEVDFIRKHIFPGGCLPSHKAILENTSKYTDLNLIDVRDLTEDYALTLKCWRERFFDRVKQVKALGFSDAFVRLWDFYLCYCEGGFAERVIGTSQLVFAKPGYRSRFSQ